jgi:hypothetical protein
MWANAWAAKAVRRTMMKYPMRPAASATIVPPTTALRMNGEDTMVHQFCW